jgi:hypothetical protein
MRVLPGLAGRVKSCDLTSWENADTVKEALLANVRSIDGNVKFPDARHRKDGFFFKQRWPLASIATVNVQSCRNAIPLLRTPPREEEPQRSCSNSPKRIEASLLFRHGSLRGIRQQ